MTGGSNDSQLIRRSLADPAAFAGIFDRHFDPVFGYLCRRVGARLAEDLAAETFVIAFERRREFRLAADDARPWLLGIATNLASRERRREGRQLRAYSRSAARALVDDALEGADDRADAARGRSLLASTLAELPVEQREVVVLHAWADLSYEEIADALSVPVGTVRSRLSRARRSFRTRLEEVGDDEYVKTADGG